MANPFAQFAQPKATSGNPFSRFAPRAQPKTFERDADEALYREKLAEEQAARGKPMVPFYASEPGGEERNLAAERRAMAPEEAAIGDVEQQRAEEGEQKAFDASRTPLKRATDAATFTLSMPVRMATRGEYGLGDVAGLVSDDAERIYKDAEADFARANEPGLKVAQAAGEIAAGIPALSTMGVPLKGVAATGTALANKPLPRSAIPRAITRNERLADIEAFEGAGVKPFGPALTEAGTAGVVKQLADAPIVGAPVRRALTEAVEQTRDAGERIAGQYGDAKTFRDVGNVVEKGLDRFKSERGEKIIGRDASLGAAEPPVPEGKVRVYHSGSAGDGEGGRWVSTDRTYAKDYRSGAPLFRLDIDANDPRINNLDYPDQGIKQGFTFNFELAPKEAKGLKPVGAVDRSTPDARLSEIARAPARETSIKTKQDALYERAWRGIPAKMQKGRSEKDNERFWGGMANTQNLLKELTERNQRMFMVRQGKKPEAPPETPMMPGMGGNFDRPAPAAPPVQDPKLAYPVRGGVAGRIVEDIVEGRWRGNLQSMREVRSSFRRLASGMGDTEKNTLQLSDFRRMQSAMTQDMISLLERNAKHYDGQKGGKETATAVRRAIHDFRRADQFTRASVGRLETIEKLYGAQSEEALALGIVKDAMGGRKGGNFSRLSALRRSLKDDEWDDVSAGVIRELGRPVASARGVAEDAGFSVQSFMTRWREMSDEGKNVLFNRPGEQGKALRTSLDRFVRVADKMANFEAMANTSRSATNALGITGLASIFTAAQQAMTGNFQTAAAAASVAGGTYAFGKFMTSPTYVRWLTRAAELSGDPGKLRSLRGHARELARLAQKEPDPAVQNLIHAVVMKLGDAIPPEAQGRR